MKRKQLNISRIDKQENYRRNQGKTLEICKRQWKQTELKIQNREIKV